MKTSIIYLGVAMMIVTSSIATNRNLKNVNSTRTENSIIELEQGDSFDTKSELFEIKKFAPVEDQTILNPESILNVKFQKNIESVIIENNKIIENNLENESVFVVGEQSIEEVIFANNQIMEGGSTSEVHPLYLERTIEDTITENNTIIENTFNTIAQPINFELLNKVTTVLKKDKILF